MYLYKRCVIDFVESCILCMDNGCIKKELFYGVYKALSLFKKRYNKSLSQDEYAEYYLRNDNVKNFILNYCIDEFPVTVSINVIILLINDIVENMKRPKDYGRLLDSLVEFYQYFDPNIDFYRDIDYGCDIGEKLQLIFQGNNVDMMNLNKSCVNE